MLKLTRRWAFATGLLAFLGCAAGAPLPFQLKGIAMGMSPIEVCGGAAISDEFGEMVQKLAGVIPDLIDPGVQACSPPIETFGGVRIASQPKLMFKDSRLIFLKIELNDVDLSDIAGFLRNFSDQYGKSVRSRSGPFVIDTWRQQSQQLEFERNGSNLEIILQDVKPFTAFRRQVDSNQRKLRAYENNRRLRDMR